MRHSNDRLVRIPDLGQMPRLRLLAVYLAVAVLAFAAGAGSARASTGGASSYAAGETGADLAFSPFQYGGASWYGPGLWGRRTACGQTLRPHTLGVAHKTLPCGTAVKFVYHGQALVTQVIDRGPYAHGRAWDLTAAASEALGFDGVGKVRYAVAATYARAR
jgi:rare lipoprotein A